MMNRLSQTLKQLKDNDRYRSLTAPRGIDLSSNDYLGMRHHPALREVAMEAIERGIALGSGGSRLLSGNCAEHRALERYAAQVFGVLRALYFSNGYQANQAVLTSLPQKGDVIVYDALIHASMREAIQFSAAQGLKFVHNDMGDLRRVLELARGKQANMIWIALESVYSMDGDVAPLDEVMALARDFGAYVVLDEAHGTGVFGANGLGLAEGIAHERLITVHACGKALGVAGGLVCAGEDVISYLVNKARNFIYSTAPPPLQAYLVHKSLELIIAEPERRKKLWDVIDYTGGLSGLAPRSPIFPLMIGDDTKAVQEAQKMQKQGFDIRAVRPPTVPEGTARLRLSLNVNLGQEDLDRFFSAHKVTA